MQEIEADFIFLIYKGSDVLPNSTLYVQQAFKKIIELGVMLLKVLQYFQGAPPCIH